MDDIGKLELNNLNMNVFELKEEKTSTQPNVSEKLDKNEEIHEDNQMDKLVNIQEDIHEDNLEENHEDEFDIEIKKYIQECKKTIN